MINRTLKSKPGYILGAEVALLVVGGAVLSLLLPRLSADIELFSRGRQGLFLIAAARAVGAKASVDFPRGSFSDLRSELGFRRWQDASLFSIFVAYERRNDASIAQSLVLDRALLGFRIEGRRADAPAVSLRP